jgi:pilus assembly protein Flp/PilA
MSNAIMKFLRDEEGATAIEYGIIAGLMAVALVGIFGTGGAIPDLLESIFTKIGTRINT